MLVLQFHPNGGGLKEVSSDYQDFAVHLHSAEIGQLPRRHGGTRFRKHVLYPGGVAVLQSMEHFLDHVVPRSVLDMGQVSHLQVGKGRVQQTLSLSIENINVSVTEKEPRGPVPEMREGYFLSLALEQLHGPVDALPDEYGLDFEVVQPAAHYVYLSLRTHGLAKVRILPGGG